jgi:hypothetical protein
VSVNVPTEVAAEGRVDESEADIGLTSWEDVPGDGAAATAVELAGVPEPAAEQPATAIASVKTAQARRARRMAEYR